MPTHIPPPAIACAVAPSPAPARIPSAATPGRGVRRVVRRRTVRVCMDCGAVACAIALDGEPAAWVAPGRPAAEELRAVAARREWLYASHGLCPTCFARRTAAVGPCGNMRGSR